MLEELQYKGHYLKLSALYLDSTCRFILSVLYIARTSKRIFLWVWPLYKGEAVVYSGFDAGFVL